MPKRKPYTVSEKVHKAHQNQVIQIEGDSINQKYWNEFSNYISDSSRINYKSGIFRVLNKIKIDIVTTTAQSIQDILDNDKKINPAHIKSILKYIVSNNIENAKERIGLDLLLFVLCDNDKPIGEVIASRIK